MNLTYLIRLACRTSALVVLAGTTSLAAMASPSTYLVSEGESRVYRLEQPVTRVAVGNPDVADFILFNHSDLYLLGKKTGATNLVIWDRKGNFTSTPLHVSRNVTPIKVLLKAELPKENDIQVFALGPALVLSGSVSDALAAETAYRLVKAYLGGTVPAVNPETTLTNNSATGPSTPATISGSGSTSSGLGSTSSASTPGTVSSAPAPVVSGLVNLLKVRDPQQVRLEVHIAEVSKSYVESLGLSLSKTSGNTQGSIMTGFISNATLNLILKSSPNISVQADANRKNSLMKILAEPTIVAMSGQEGYFLVGGKIYTSTVGANGSIDYVERSYGVGLHFTPIVLDAGRISLKVAPEVSEPNTEPVTAGTTVNLPAFKISYASTIVQMNEGENLVIGGLLRDKLIESVQRIPLLGDLPLLGTLFRHTEKNYETTELMVFIRPTLVKASTAVPELPTDRYVAPSQKELFLDGKLEGSRVK
ncbi:MAG TPA: pilus assembly protein N-terminal domain-containing protein [Chlorobaculum sp.]|nr:pilus assembly protein N-terminal domain-containing protein [Chlorobaculum sp.]